MLKIYANLGSETYIRTWLRDRTEVRRTCALILKIFSRNKFIYYDWLQFLWWIQLTIKQFLFLQACVIKEAVRKN